MELLNDFDMFFLELEIFNISMEINKQNKNKKIK